jgi:DNA-3-methyladenine glycosylase II
MHRRALRHLRDADPVMAGIIDRVGPCRLAPATELTHFESVARSIVYQQLSGKAAATIYGRFEGLFRGARPSAAPLLRLPMARLRAAGLSRQKAAYLRDLAERVTAGEVPIESLHELPDDDVIGHLTRVKGVGVWTAQMFLLFRLGRPDVLPDLDLGVQKAVQLAYRLRKRPPPERVRKIGAAWAPWRSIATWYLWRSLEDVAD